MPTRRASPRVESAQWGFHTKNPLITLGSCPKGGAIKVTANDPHDKVTRDAIRTHLSHIVQMFTDGNFKVSIFIHDTVPPGVPAMKSNGATIAYVFEPILNGARVRIKTTDAEALRAVHQFLTLQIDDHRTGDPRVVAASR
jgi:hypothetical protein